MFRAHSENQEEARLEQTFYQPIEKTITKQTCLSVLLTGQLSRPTRVRQRTTATRSPHNTLLKWRVCDVSIHVDGRATPFFSPRAIYSSPEKRRCSELKKHNCDTQVAGSLCTVSDVRFHETNDRRLFFSTSRHNKTSAVDASQRCTLTHISSFEIIHQTSRRPTATRFCFGKFFGKNFPNSVAFAEGFGGSKDDPYDDNHSW
jgi:hypothetical protein